MSEIINCTPVSYTIGFYLEGHGEGGIWDMDQPYQRGLVWGVERQRELILSLLTGFPYGAIIINKRVSAGFSHPGYSDERNAMYAVVDGKQRLTAIRDFVAGKFAIPAEWAEVDTGGEIRFSDLPQAKQRAFLDTPLVGSQAEVASMEEELEMFNRVNFGGVAQGDVDEDRELGAEQ